MDLRVDHPVQPNNSRQTPERYRIDAVGNTGSESERRA